MCIHACDHIKIDNFDDKEITKEYAEVVNELMDFEKQAMDVYKIKYELNKVFGKEVCKYSEQNTK